MLRISPHVPTIDNLIFGGSTIGCLYKEVPSYQANQALYEALRLGVRYFDTAPLYGAGLSETRLGAYLPKNLDGKDILISTKAGRIIKEKKKVTIRNFSCRYTKVKIYIFSHPPRWILFLKRGNLDH